MLRPAYGAFDDLAESVKSTDSPAGTHRDPRTARDQAHDMRMPPYMRDETASALSLTRRQYVEVLRLIDALADRKATAAAATPEAAVAAAARGADMVAAAAPAVDEESGVRQRVRAVLARANAQRRTGR